MLNELSIVTGAALKQLHRRDNKAYRIGGFLIVSLAEIQFLTVDSVIVIDSGKPFMSSSPAIEPHKVRVQCLASCLLAF